MKHQATQLGLGEAVTEMMVHIDGEKKRRILACINKDGYQLLS